jgi:hypothetical protein
MQVTEKFNRGSSAYDDRALSRKDADGENIFSKHWKIDSQLQPNPELLVIDSLAKYLPIGTEVESMGGVKWEDLIR